MSEESFSQFLYVALPNVPSATGSSNTANHDHSEHHLDMVNILTPILNVEENVVVGTITNGANDKQQHHHPTTTAEIVEIKTEVDGGSILVDDGSGSDLDIKRHERLQKDIIRKKMARLRETEQQRTQRLQKDRERKKQARQNETLEQRQRRLEKDRIRIQRRRALETDEERKRRLEKNRISKRNARIKENSRFRI